MSVFNGLLPVISTFGSDGDEADAVAAWLKEHCKDGLVPDEIGIFVRSEAELDRARACVSKARLSS